MKFLIYKEKKIAKSTEGDEWYKYADNGGYVHPVEMYSKIKLN